MSNAGAPKTPHYLKVLKGTDRSDRAPKSELTGGLEKLPPPPRSFDKFEKKEYKRLGDSAISLGILYEIHLPELEYIAELFALSTKLKSQSKRQKIPNLEIIKSSTSGKISSWIEDPYLKKAREYKREALKLWRSFGGSPADLEQLTLKQADNESEDWNK